MPGASDTDVGRVGGLVFEERRLKSRTKAMSGQKVSSLTQTARLMMTEGEKLDPTRFGGGLLCTGRTIPYFNGSSLAEMAGFNRLQEVKGRIERQGEDVNTKNSNGDTALFAAAVNGHVEMCSYLISQGADVLTASMGGMTALHLAAREGHTDIIRLMASTSGFYRPDLDLKTSGGRIRVRARVSPFLFTRAEDALWVSVRHVACMIALHALIVFPSRLNI